LVIVVVGFWPSSRSRHVSGHLEASLLCQLARLTKPNMEPKRSLRPRLGPTSIRHHSPGSTTQPELCDSSRRQ